MEIVKFILEFVFTEASIFCFSVAMSIFSMPRDRWYNITCDRWWLAMKEFESRDEWEQYRTYWIAETWRTVGNVWFASLNLIAVLVLLYVYMSNL